MQMNEKKLKEITYLVNGIGFICRDQPVSIITYAIAKFWDVYIKQAPPKQRYSITKALMVFIGSTILIDPTTLPQDEGLAEIHKLQKELDEVFKRLLDEQKQNNEKTDST